MKLKLSANLTFNYFYVTHKQHSSHIRLFVIFSSYDSYHFSGKLKKSEPGNIAICLSEFIGTAFLMFLGCVGCAWTGIGPFIIYLPTFTFGLAVLTVVQMFGHVSGAHVNPAVTISAVCLGMLKLKKVPFYIAGQFIGAIVGFGILKLLIPTVYTATEIFDEVKNITQKTPGLCTTVIHEEMSPFQGLAVEMIITSGLILVCAAIWDKRNASNTDSISIKFGLIVACIAMGSGSFTGASMNTARSFAPALLNGYWKDQWVYWVGPNLAAIIVSFLYKFVFSQRNEEDYEGEELTDLNAEKNNVNKV